MTKDKGQYIAHNAIKPEIKNNKLHVTGGDMKYSHQSGDYITNWMPLPPAPESEV